MHHTKGAGDYTFFLLKAIGAVKVGRFDFDTTRTKSSQEKLLSSFETGELQVLVGTQMVTKGFDFDHVQLVGIINADALMNQPDFRANERAFKICVHYYGLPIRYEVNYIFYIRVFNVLKMTC